MSYVEVERLVRKELLEDLYEVGQELGRGKFAIVKRVTEKSSGDQYAAKFLRKRRGGKACRDDIIVEIDVMRQSMGHHRIIKLREVFESTREMILILELATGGELFRMIAVDPLPEDKARNVVLQLLEGVEHLHCLNIVHLDLKPENILLYRKGALDIRIADFGLALQITPGQQVKTLVGTAEYVAPEILNYEPLSIAADMWSIGALTYALLAGYSPFQGETHSHTFYNVSMCEYDFEDEVFDVVSQEAKDFIEELLQKKPNDRLTASKCLKHPWISNQACVPIPPPQTPIVNEGLNSSTSSLDSALCLDSASSLEPSPSSSASSSFAPRPTGRTEEDDALQQDDMRKQLAEKVSKLCTEMQKAERDGSGLHAPLDGSASSISSTDSSNTIKVDEEDGETVFDKDAVTSHPPPSNPIPSTSSGVHTTSTSPTPRAPSTPPMSRPPSSPPSESNRTKRSPSSGSSMDDDQQSQSRPSSSLRVTTPVEDLVSLAPDTIEKLKKLEQLKQRKRGVATEDSKQSPESTRRKASVEVDRIIAPRNSERRTSSPANLSSFSSKTKVIPKLETTKETIEEHSDKKSPINDKTVPVTSKILPPNLSTVSDDINTPSNTKRNDKAPPTTNDQEALLSQSDKSRSYSPSPRERLPCSLSPKLNSFVRSTSPEVKISETVEQLSDKIVPPTNRARSNSPLSSAEKSFVPPRSTKSSSPLSPEVIGDVKRRPKVTNNQTRKSWRTTPHIDPDAIDALLRGEIDESDITLNAGEKLETMVEEVEPRACSPLAGKTSSSERSSSRDLSPEEPVTPILKKGGSSESKVNTVSKKETPKRVMILSSGSNNTGTIQLHSSPEHFVSSPLKSPGAYSESGSRESSPMKRDHLSVLQSSMSLSRSTPDLSTILGSTKHSKRAPPREDSYVTGNSSSRKSSISRTSSIRSNLLSGTSIVRSFTMSGRNNNTKRSPSLSREKFKLK